MINFLKSICPPALIYLVFSMTQIIIDTYKGLYNVSLIKFIVMVFFTLLLNLLCMNGLGIVSWIIVFVPFILMSVITALLLLFFDLNTTTGKIKQKPHDNKHHHNKHHEHHHNKHHEHHNKHHEHHDKHHDNKHHNTHHDKHHDNKHHDNKHHDNKHHDHHDNKHHDHHIKRHFTIYEDDQGNYSYENKHENNHEHKHENNHEHKHADITGHTLNNRPKQDTNSIYNNMIKETNDIFPF